LKRKILIEKSKNKIRTYLIEDDDIVEIHTSINEEQVPPGKLGDIYIGKVQNIVQNIGAAFISSSVSVGSPSMKYSFTFVHPPSKA
jgi:Ribonuclease G/E